MARLPRLNLAKKQTEKKTGLWSKSKPQSGDRKFEKYKEGKENG